MSADTVVVVAGRKKLHTFKRYSVEVNGVQRFGWHLNTPKSAQQKRHSPVTGATSLRETNSRSAAGARASVAQSSAWQLGEGIVVKPRVLEPILDGLVAAADGGEDLPAGVWTEAHQLLIELGVLQVFVTRKR